MDKKGGGVGAYFPVSGAVGLDSPAGLIAEGFKDLIIVAMLWEFVVPVHSQAGEYIGRDSSPPPLPPLVVLPLLPRRQPRPRRHLPHPKLPLPL